MHELPITRAVLDIALEFAAKESATRVVSIDLRVGELRDLVEEWAQRYFDYVSKGTI